MRVNALLDDASGKSFVNDNVARKLNLHGYAQTMKIGVLNGGVRELDTMSVDVELQSVNGKFSRHMIMYTADEVTGDMSVTDWKQEAKQWPHLKDIVFPDLGGNDRVDVLIGVDHHDLHFSYCDIRGRRGEPSARLTPLGWTCVSA